MLRGLKGGLSFAAALQLIERLALNGANPLEAPIFVHPPSRTGRRDHAWLLAQLLARQWQFATGPALSLRFTEQHLLTAQKSKSAADRSLLRYQSLENLSKSRSFVFVDDIITTGSTAMAAFMALGEPERFSVFAIVSRPKRRAQLAGKSGIW